QVLVGQRRLGVGALLPPGGQAAALALVDPQQQRLVLGVQREPLVLALVGGLEGRTFARPAQPLALDAPAVDVVQLPRGEEAGRVPREAFAQRRAVGQQARPLAQYVARARAHRAARVLQRVARGRIQR